MEKKKKKKRRLAWPLRKDDMQIREAFHIKKNKKKKFMLKIQYQNSKLEKHCSINMTKEFKSPITYHCAISLDNFAIIIGGQCGIKQPEPLSTHLIWIYNLYTEEWTSHIIPDTSCTPKPFLGAVAAAINKTVYIFGGRSAATNWNETNALWKLNRTKVGGFSWSFSNPQCKEKSPSPRTGHTGWEYAGQLWIFAGVGPSPQGYLNDHGDIEGYLRRAGNNQLLCFDLSNENWSNPQCSGSVPAPRFSHASAIIKDTV